MKQRLGFLAILIVPIISLIIAVYTLSDYGINWDEPYHFRRGQSFLQFFLTGQKNYDNISKYPPLKGDSDNPDFRNAQKNFEQIQKNPSLSNPHLRRSFYQDDSWNGEYFIDIENPYGHPALNDILAALFNKIFYQKVGILGDIESYHFFIILTVSLATFSLAIFMWKEFGIVESVFSSLAFVSYPLILGEQHFNIKDPVETAFYTITIIATYLGVKKNKLVWFFIGTLFFSLAISTKFNIVFSLVPLGTWFFYYLYQNMTKINKAKLFKNIVLVMAIAPFIVLGILFASYPTLWRNPINNFGQIVKFYLEVGYPQSAITGYYLLGFFNTLPSLLIAYSTPPIVLLLFFISLIFIKKLTKNNSFTLLLLVWVLTTIGRNSFLGALNYGGVRLIMEYIPPIAMLAGISAGYIIKIMKNKTIKIAIVLIIVLGFIPTIIKLIQIHPNENVYFNLIVGGLSGAKEKNIPSWGNSNGNAYYQTVLWLNRNAEPNSKISIPVGNTSNIPRFKLRPDLAISPYYWSGLKHQGEYLIELTYDYPPKDWFALRFLNEAVIPVYEVRVDDVAIAKVWKNDRQHIKSEFKKTKDIKADLTSNPRTKSVRVDIPTPEKIMKVKIIQPIKDCEPLHTGYVLSSADQKSWTREAEDAAADQLNREEIKRLTPDYEFLFMAKKARTVIFNVDSENSCLLKAKQATVTILEK